MALLKALLLLLGLGVSVNSGVSLQKRIIGGQNCLDTERLYHVRLESSNGTHSHRCGGSLIHKQWILTVSHCWKSEPGWTNEAVLKVHPRTAGQQRQRLQQAPMIYSEKGKEESITLLKLETPVTDVELAPLPNCGYRPLKHSHLKLAGEGAMTTGPNNQQITAAPIAPHLQCVDMKIVKKTSFLPTVGYVYYASAPNKDICYADAGGAVLHHDRVYGLISPREVHACQRQVLILDVCHYMEWVNTAIGRGKKRTVMK